MARRSAGYICRTCGSVHAKWMGKCPDCGTWDSLEATAAAPASVRGGPSGADVALVEATPIDRPGSHDDLPPLQRLTSGIGELDRVLGGDHSEGSPDLTRCGLVPGSSILVGGDPGIGKSTLLLQAAAEWARRGHRTLYVTSEESAGQLRLRARRLGVLQPAPADLLVLAETNLSRILEQCRRHGPAVVVIDSIQMIDKSDMPAAPGSVTQLRACCMELVHQAKSSGMAVVLVGHVTKEGRLAGPRLLEHMVDAVLYFEGDRYHSHRIIRAIKNRYGATLEVGLFEMSEAGLREVADGAGLLAKEYEPRSGSVVSCVLQGSRCMLVEVQALTATGFLGAAKRKTSGIDSNRLAMLIAVLEKRGGLRLADQDVFTSIVGGIKVPEPAVDLAVALAIAGAYLNRRLGEEQGGCCVIGEIGLGGEIRHVQQMGQRVNEAVRLGFTTVVGPRFSGPTPGKCRYQTVRRLDEALELLT